MKKLSLVFTAFLFAGTTTLFGQANELEAQKGMKLTEHGLGYKFTKNGTGRTANIGDFAMMQMTMIAGDSLIFDSRTNGSGQPLPLTINKPAFNGDMAEGFVMMSQGDSAVFFIPVDSIMKLNPNLPPFMKAGHRVEYRVVMKKLMTAEEKKADDMKMKAEAAGKDDKTLQEYFVKNKIKATKTASGLYYSMKTEGKGTTPKTGQKIIVNYTGMLMDGTKFDSNVDSAFQHVQPFTLNIGVGQVIPGWDEGLMLFKKGGKGTLYIPSSLAYGSQGQGRIAPNSILIFDIELKDIIVEVSGSEPQPVSNEQKEKPKSTKK